MASPFDGYEVEAGMRPEAQEWAFDLDRVLSSVVALEARVAPDAFTAQTLGVDRIGNATVLNANGLVLTMGYLVMEAEEVVLTRNDGVRVPAHVLGVDAVTGFGLAQALEPLDLPALPLGDSRKLQAGGRVIIAGAGGRTHAADGRVLARMRFAGYWEYLLDEAIMTGPAHPHWSGAALVDESGGLVGVGSLALQGQTQEGEAAPLNMFVPSELLAPILDDLASGRPAHPPRPWLGVLAQDFRDHVVIVGVNPHGPAARAELRAGDIIRAVGAKPVTDLAEFYKALWAQGEPGALIPLRVEREGDAFDLEVRSADRGAMLKKPKLN